MPVPPKNVGQQNRIRRSSTNGGSPWEFTEESERSKDLAKNEEQYMQKNSRHMSVTPQNVGRRNPRSSAHEGTPREYIDESEHRKGTEYRNDLGKTEAAKQSRIIEEKEKMIQNLTTR